MTTAEPEVAAPLRAMGLFTDVAITADPTPTMASPSWWSADSECFDVRPADDSHRSSPVFVKTMIAHAGAYVDVRQAFAAAVEAGETGVGPRVYAADADAGVLVQENLLDSASTATLDVFDDHARLERLFELRKRVRDFGSITRVAGVFDEIRVLTDLAEAQDVRLPADFEWMLRQLDLAEQRILAAGFDLVAAHGDGNVSNVLVRSDGELLLVDWDCAGLMDPLQDIGAVLAEVRPFDVDARSAFEMAWGTFDQSLFDRARLYGVADCVKWGLIGAYADAARPGTLEYSKFSDWQFVRARIGLGDAHHFDRLRNI
ncbi:phosphotransferase [Mycolicibacterium smegmatis]|uniref:phosphotransferase n=1 Tax=Mycolicibacterium smegmatis TaxID=1772 RepID=UPI001302F46B|nr:phosphotransferase [Mycolicibacterium smegmatis]